MKFPLFPNKFTSYKKQKSTKKQLPSIERGPDPQQLHILLFIAGIFFTIEPGLPLPGPPDLLDILVLFVMNHSQPVDFLLQVPILFQQLL